MKSFTSQLGNSPEISLSRLPRCQLFRGPRHKKRTLSHFFSETFGFTISQQRCPAELSFKISHLNFKIKCFRNWYWLNFRPRIFLLNIMFKLSWNHKQLCCYIQERLGAAVQKSLWSDLSCRIITLAGVILAKLDLFSARRVTCLDLPCDLVGVAVGMFHAQYDWTTGVPDNGNEWRKFRAATRSYPLRSLVLYFVY